MGFFLIETLLIVFVDRPLASYMHALDMQNQQMHSVINFFRYITDLGKGCWYLWPCSIITIFCAFLSRGGDVPSRYRRLFGYIGVRTLFLFSTIAISGIIANIIKPIIGRARPVLWLRDQIYGFEPFSLADAAWKSMPSGHATTVFALAFSLAALYPRGRIIWFLYAFLVALSRIFVSAHYLSDVLAGMVLGGLTVCFFRIYGMSPLGEIIFPIDKSSKMH